MSKLAWYWHRLRAMDPAEVALHARKKVRQFFDARSLPNWRRWELTATNAFPSLPDPEKAPQVLRDALKRDAEDIIAGRWKAFGHLELRVDDPPKWHKDYFVGRDLATEVSAFRLDHRELPGGADIKLIWELSRWHQLVRLAMAAYVLDDERAAHKCMEWLEDWVKHNPPYRGWNWTSALEVGIRLIQFTWIHALIESAPNRSSALQQRLEGLRRAILPAHAHYAWRHKSFGSSANNHLLGELAGLIIACARWPHLIDWWVSLEELKQLWEREVLAQFAEDGGNKEQALNYHLFSWEFCWQAMFALYRSDREISPEVSLRLYEAADFYVKVQVDGDTWDYGDSDNGFVTPFFAHEPAAVSEWRNWMTDRTRSPALDFWLGETRRQFKEQLISATSDTQRTRAKFQSASGTAANPEEDWLHYPRSGQCVARVGQWSLRWDVSPLGYLKTAAHGHLDALHLSLWLKGVGIVIDPGTGAYYADPRLRSWLASSGAHNGPRPIGAELLKRLGPFLWDEADLIPLVTRNGAAITGIVNLGDAQLRRTLTHSPAAVSWTAEDGCFGKDVNRIPFCVRWQFAPGAWVKRLGERMFCVHRESVAVQIQVDESWAEVELVEMSATADPQPISSRESLEGVVSPAFRKVCWAPFLKLTARPETGKSCVFRTTFLASPPA